MGGWLRHTMVPQVLLKLIKKTFFDIQFGATMSFDVQFGARCAVSEEEAERVRGEERARI